MKSNEEVLGEMLQKYRKRNGWSRSELAKRSGFSQRYLEYLEYVEAGSKSVTVRTLFRICEALEVQPAEVIRAVESGRRSRHP